MAYSNNYRSNRGRGHDKQGSDRPQMHEATCSKCGKSCLVPFKPTGNRPIFCSDCFRTEGGTSTNRRDDRGPRSSSDRPMYDAICENCGNRCQIPFSPKPGRKVYCSHCFEQMEKGEQNQIQNAPADTRLQDQLDSINIKLGKILQMLSDTAHEQAVSENKAEKH